MTLKELLELAQAEALGLLDEPDQKEFDAAFAKAPAAIKEQVRAEQARWASSDAWLPMASPDAALRGKVLASVSHAMLSETGVDATSELVGTGQVSRLWRTASIGLLTAALVFGAAFVSVSRENARVVRSLEDGRFLQGAASLRGNDQTDYVRGWLFDPRTTRTIFSPGPGGGEGSAAVFTHPDWATVRLFIAGLPRLEQGREYRIVAVEGDLAAARVIEDHGTFAAGSALATLDAPRSSHMLAIVEAAVGEALVGTALPGSRVLLVTTP